MSFIITYKYDDEDVYRIAGYARSCVDVEIKEIVSQFAVLAQVSDIHLEETNRRLPFKIFTP